MAIEQVTLKITGKMPLIMHSNRSVNTRDPLVREKNEIARKPSKSKTDEDLDRMDYLEWQLGLYYKPEVGPYLPGRAVHACLRDAAKKSRQGALVTEAVWIDESELPLIYEGPRDIDGLFADGRFFDVRPVGVNGKTVNRARPIFPQWRLIVTITYDAEFINRDDVLRIAETAGRRIGVGDYRPTFGRFMVEEVR